MASIFRFPKPRSFLHIIPLRTAAEFIALTLLINKVTGFYGILAIFTGYHLNPLQLSHYIYSLVILAVAAWLANSTRPPPSGPTIGTALKNLGLAWVYIIDTVVNGVYTTLFGLGWFVLLAQQHGIVDGDASAPGKGMMGDTAGFTNPEVNASSVDIVAKPAPGLLSGQEATAYPSAAPSAAGASLGSVMQSDSVTSILFLGILWLIRVYFCLLMLSYARSVLRQYIASTSASTAGFTTENASTDPTMAPNPFSGPNATSWKASVGRAMLRFPSKRYWLGREEQSGNGSSEWERATSGKFESGRKVLHIRVPSDRGNAERERRARSGTGPPAKLEQAE